MPLPTNQPPPPAGSVQRPAPVSPTGPAEQFNPLENHPEAHRFSREREPWEPLLPDCAGNEADVVTVAIQTVRFAISGLYDLPPRYDYTRTAKPVSSVDMAFIPEEQMRAIRAAPMEAMLRAREIIQEFNERYYRRGSQWTRMQAREALFNRLSHLVTAEPWITP